MTPPAWRKGLSGKSQKNKRKISLQKERAEGRERSINKGWKDWPRECGIRECLFSKQKLTNQVLFNRWQKWIEQSLCLGLGTCPQWPRLLSPHEWLLFSWLWWQPLSKQNSSVSYHKLQEACVWPGRPSRFAGSLRIPTSCLAHTLEQPKEASPAIPWQTIWRDWRAVPRKARFRLAPFRALLFFTNASSKKALRQGSHVFFSRVLGH